MSKPGGYQTTDEVEALREEPEASFADFLRIGHFSQYLAKQSKPPIAFRPFSQYLAEPLASALARNDEHCRELLEAAGGAFEASRVSEILAISRQAVDEQRRAGSLLAFRRGSDWQYPACQFSDGNTIDGLAEVLREVGRRDPWLTLDFLLSEDSVLGGMSPLAALKKGGEWREQVLRLARAERGEGGFP